MDGLEGWFPGGEYAKMKESAACVEGFNEEEDTCSFQLLRGGLSEKGIAHGQNDEQEGLVQATNDK